MTLRKKTLIISITITLLMISLINASTRFILLSSFSSLEEKYCIDNVRRAANAIMNEKIGLLTEVKDYAIWDDTYAFVADRTQDYVQINFTPATFINLNINFLIITDPTGQVIASGGYDVLQQQPLSVPVEILNLVSQTPLFHNPDLNTESTGFILINGRPVMLAYHAILTSLETGPSNGVLILGKFLEYDFADQLSAITQLPLQIAAYKDSKLALEYQAARPVQGSDPEISIKILDSQTIVGYKIFPDIFGNPALILRTDTERDIYTQGHSTIMFFIYVVFFGSLFFITTAIIMLDKEVISRITSLSKAVTRVRMSGTLVDRVQVRGKDEIAFLGGEINEMLQSIEIADGQLRTSRDELEKRIEDRTAEISQVNEELKYEIAERELGQRALFEAYNEINLILGSISSIMIGVDSDSIVTQWNHAAVRLFGLAAVDVIGQNFFNLPIAWDWKIFTQEVNKCVKNNRKIRMDDFLLETAGASPRILGISLSPLAQKDRETPGFLLIGSDITERRQLEQQVGRTNKLESIGQLAAGVAHEINTPTQLVGSNLRFLGQQLAPVLGLVDKIYQLNRSVKDGTATPQAALALEKEAAAAHLEFFRQEAPVAIEQSLEGIERISHIVAAMRFFMHPGSEGKELASLNDVIENALSLSRNEWKNVAEIKTDLDPDLPAVECLPSDLSQVVLNLIINAVHAIQDSGSEDQEAYGEISISSRQAGAAVEMRITDSGIGIPEEIRDKVFDLFFTTKDVGRGTGQGLALAYTVIVKKHGGTIEFESEVGHGTTFIIKLPIKADYDEKNTSG